jgi:hypothetical protein
MQRILAAAAECNPIARQIGSPVAAFADTADNAGKIQRRNLARPQKLWLFEACSHKITAKNSDQ